MNRVNECMVRAGLLVGLALGFLVLGYANVAGAVGIFAAVQILNIVADARRRPAPPVNARVPRGP